MKLSGILDSGRIAAGGLRDLAAGIAAPSLRLGVTGLSRSGKTVFIAALVRALTKGTRLPRFTAHEAVSRAYLEPQPDDDLPRFSYEDHIAALTGSDRRWPESTRRVSQLRLTLDYVPRGLIARNFGRGRLHVDIVDYPGEWLLDLPLMTMSWQEWSAATIAASDRPPRSLHVGDWRRHLATLDPAAPADEAQAVEAARLFTAYLARCRKDDVSLSALPPGRFLMPGDLDGSPLLTFAPLAIAPDDRIVRGSLAALMERRYESYVAKVVKPFFFGHFARLDRQIVLVDALTALNAGAPAVADLKAALADTLACFRQGSNSILSRVLGRRIDRILFAATKADLLHHESHRHLEAILRLIVEQAAERASFAGAETAVIPLAAIRATREATLSQKSEDLACIAGTPEAGETIAGTVFDGATEAAIFPGDLPADPTETLDGSLEGKLQFVKFRPPFARDGQFPHINLDLAIEYLLGDRFR